MPIDVTFVRERGHASSFRRLLKALPNFFPETPLSKRQVLTRSICGVLAIVLIGAGDSLLKSYKYYSRIIDARLATGYVNSRPGLYSAPRTIRAGQRLSQGELVKTLRRSGYIENTRSNVWNGSFRQTDSVVDIQPSRGDAGPPTVVRVSFENGEKIAELTSDGLPLESYVLEPEVLSNDVSMKDGTHESLSYSEIPPVLINAILSIEDQRFFQHSGVDPFGVARAIVRNAGDDHSGQGGSTITQQLVKNTYLSPEKTIKRKYAEAMLAYALERRLSKQDIFALYCSQIYLGQRGALAVRGVKEAARVYFGKELKNLSLEEAATIAGTIQSPARYSPTHREAAQARRVLVLQAMERQGFITAPEADAAGKATLNCVDNKSENSIAPYFVDYVNQNSDSQFAASVASHRLYTTIDVQLQQLAEAALKRQLSLLDSSYKNRTAKPQAALVALDPKTGNVLAMVGGRDYAKSQLNRATDARRQPGSTFKPFVYAAAMEDGMSPVRTFNDAPREFVYDHNRIYRPANYAGGYSMHDVTMRSGLVNSLNVVTVDIAMQTGLARVANLAQQFGLPRPERYPSLALGTEEVTPLELAAAYAAFVNDGQRVKPKVILGVGEPPATHTFADESSQVISPTTAYMITNMLSAVVDHGTARGARNRIAGTAIAGKTGTSRDGWFVGYTPNLVCAVWIGFDDNQQLGLSGAQAALPAWVEFVKGAVELRPELGGRNFECPEGIKFVEIDADSGSISTLSCPHRELIAVTDRLAPNVECYQHGNLPQHVDDNEKPDTGPDTTSIARHRQKSSSLAATITPVEVDRRGRPTLVNSLR